MGCKNSTDKDQSGLSSSGGGGGFFVATSKCHFCQKSFPVKDFNAHTVLCDQREVTCWHSWCREKVKQGDLQTHMEQCGKKRRSYCVKCGESILSSELAAHRDSCHLRQCEHCGEHVIARIVKYCPLRHLAKLSIVVGPFAGEALANKFPSSEPDAHVAKIQHLWRWNKSKQTLEDILFRLIYKEMDLKKEGFAIFKAHDKVSEAHILAPKRSRSVINQAVAPQGDANHYFPSNSSVPVTIDHVQRLIKDVHNGVPVPFSVAWRIFNDTAQLLQTLPNIQVLAPPSGARLMNGRWVAGGKVIVVGDLHGQLADLRYILSENGIPSETTHYVFNGDFVDRGQFGVEVVLILFALFLACPKAVALNRGNHECDYMNEEYGFDVEVTTKYDRNMFRLLQRCFCALPLATLIGDSIFVVHGGIPRRKGVTLEDIRRVRRFRQIPMPELQQPEEDEIFQDLLWSDPWEKPGWQESERGAGVMWGPDVTADFLLLNRLKLIVRSHEEFMKGYEEHHGGKVVTVFSASNYDGPETNKGSCLTLAGDFLEPSFLTHQVTDDEYVVLEEDEEGALRRTFSADKISGTNRTPTTDILGSKYNLARQRRSREEVLRVLRERIYQRRHRMLAYFTKLDRTLKGTVWKIEWVEVMRNVLNLELPWFFLRAYIADEDPVTHRIQYTYFLTRFHNAFTQLWLKDWEASMAQQIKLQSKVTHRFEHLHQAFSSEAVNYNVFCSVMRTVDYALSDAQLFQLFVYFDKELKGYINGFQFLSEIDNVDVNKRSGARWELDAMEQLEIIIIQGRSQLPSVFKVTYKDRVLTKEKYLAGMSVISRGMKKQLTPAQQEAMFDFLDAKREGKISFDTFLQAFSVFDVDTVDTGAQTGMTWTMSMIGGSF